MRVEFADYLDRYAGRRFVIIGKGPTPLDFARLTETTDPVIFINDAVQFAPAARRSSERFFFCHDERQAVYMTEDLEATAVLARAPDERQRAVRDPHQGRFFAEEHPETAARLARWVEWEWGGRYGGPLGLVPKAEVADTRKLFIGGGGTIHSAIHWAWFCGARELAFVGCDGTEGYDPRIDIRSGAPDLGVHGRIRQVQDRIARDLGLAVEYVRTEALVPVIPPVAHFAWFGGEPPDGVWQNVERFSALHADWIVNFWRDWPLGFDPDLLEAARACGQFCQWADVLYCWLLREQGGFVLDTDIVAARSFEPLRRGREAFTTRHHDTHHRLTNGAMGSVVHSRAFERACEEIVRIHRAGPPRDAAGVKRCTYGPDMLSRLFSMNGDADLSLVPWHWFYPFRIKFGDKELAARWAASDADGRREIFDRIRDRFSDGVEPYAVHLWGIEGSSHRQVEEAAAS